MPLEVAHHEWRLNALDEWRGRVDHDLAVLDEKVGGLISADAIAEAVAVRQRADFAKLISLPQKIGAGFVGLVVLSASVVALVQGIQGLFG